MARHHGQEITCSQSRPLSDSIILADFRPFKAVPPLAQEDTRMLLAWGIAANKCTEQDTQSQEQAVAIFEEVKAKVMQYGVSPSYIKQRQMILAPSGYSPQMLYGPFSFDAVADLAAHSPLHNNGSSLNPPLEDRMSMYEGVVDQCLDHMYGTEDEGPDHLIHVTCSGYISPSPVEKLVSQKRWWDTAVTHSYHMGCYGSLPAIRMAHGFLASSMLGATPLKGRVDLVHTELFSTHSDLTKDNVANILTMTLFGDGFIRYSAYRHGVFAGLGKNGLRILAMKEHILPDSLGDMTWNLGSSSFQMTLSILVPLHIKNAVVPFVNTLFDEAGLDFASEKSRLVYAIHPGGPAIIDHIADQLDLSDLDIALSRKILFENGNISSATLPYMFHQITESEEIKAGTRVLAIAFGPGLTVSGLLLEKV